MFLAVWNGDLHGVIAAIQSGANVNSPGPKHGFYDPASPLIGCKFNSLVIKRLIILENLSNV
jgi:hypothetical protein